MYLGTLSQIVNKTYDKKRRYPMGVHSLFLE